MVSTELAPTQVALPALSRVASALERIVFFSLLGLIPLVAIPYGTVEPWWQAAFVCAVYFLAALSLIEWGMNDVSRFDHWKIFLPLIALIIFAWFQTLPLSEIGEIAGVKGEFWQAVSADPYNTHRFALRLLALVLTGAMLLRYTSNQQRLYSLVWVILSTGLLSALFGLMRQTAQTDTNRFILPYLPLNSGYAQFINRNHFAFLMELTLGLAVGMMLSGRPRSYASGNTGQGRWLSYAALSLPLWLALVLANSRGGFFSMFCLMVFVAVLWHNTKTGRTRFTRVALACSFLAAIFVGSLWVGGDPLINRLETVSSEVAQFSSTDIRRVEVWRVTWNLIKDHWMAGVGFGGYWAALPAYHQASGRLIPEEAHNDYLELLASGGVISVALIGWFLLIFMHCVRLRWRQSGIEQRAIRLGALAGLFAVAVHSFFDFGLHITVNALIATALMVIVVRQDDTVYPVSKKLTFRSGQNF